MKSIFIKNGVIVTLGNHNKVLKNHGLLIHGDKIEKIAPMTEFTDEEVQNARKIDAKDRIVMPGFINAHMHYYSSFAKGLNKALPSKNFSEVLENLWWRLDKQLTTDDCYYSAMLANIEAIKHGCTTIIDHHASPGAVLGSLDSIAWAVKDAGLKASLCYELSDRDGQDIAEKGIEENIAFIKQVEQRKYSNLRAHFGMHASFTISDKTMKKAVEAARKHDVGFHIHCAEDKVDQQKCLEEHNMRVVERLHKMGVLGRKTICAHGIHLSDNELNLLKETDTIVVHNPQSNMNNAVGIANIFKMLDKGLLVGLGTDAMTNNMMEELRAALWAHKLASKNPSVAFMECTNMLLHGNAQIAGRFWEGFGLGELKEGNEADVILVDYLYPTTFEADTFLGHLVFGMSQATVNTTIASGKILMEDRRLTTLNEERITIKAYELSKKVWDRF